MPLESGKSKAVVSSNIAEMLRSDTFAKGKDHQKRKQMAIAAAFSNAEKFKARSRRVK